jgi:hypothetical protein
MVLVEISGYRSRLFKIIQSVVLQTMLFHREICCLYASFHDRVENRIKDILFNAIVSFWGGEK